eukprot:scaffold3350_cov78-Skeletonema_marinoi.AAC.2
MAAFCVESYISLLASRFWKKTVFSFAGFCRIGPPSRTATAHGFGRYRVQCLRFMYKHTLLGRRGNSCCHYQVAHRSSGGGLSGYVLTQGRM